MLFGKIIVIEGLDGSGKKTQSRILADQLSERGHNVKIISIPNYKSLSSGPLRIYLQGGLSENAFDVNAYAASSFFAVDRFINYIKFWKDFYQKKDSILICDRYTTSNMIYQLAKIKRECWDEFLEWLIEYEYKKLEIPEPDAVVYLKIPLKISQELMKIRYKGDISRRDLHESDEKYLVECELAAQYSSRKFNWNIIDCLDKNEKIDTTERISNKILKIAKSIIEG
ncbi:MAG: thymidylate kinase [Oscillospiraceae bacterium]|jgi:dTMP kinase|nr:thymidylate kinase [Oscillospiraceae bacterium]